VKAQSLAPAITVWQQKKKSWNSC